MFKHYFEGISGIEIYPIILLVIFLLFFVSISVWMIRANKLSMQEQSRIPLEENAEEKVVSN